MFFGVILLFFSFLMVHCLMRLSHFGTTVTFCHTLTFTMAQPSVPLPHKKKVLQKCVRHPCGTCVIIAIPICFISSLVQ